MFTFFYEYNELREITTSILKEMCYEDRANTGWSQRRASSRENTCQHQERKEHILTSVVWVLWHQAKEYSLK